MRTPRSHGEHARPFLGISALARGVLVVHPGIGREVRPWARGRFVMLRFIAVGLTGILFLAGCSGGAERANVNEGGAAAALADDAEQAAQLDGLRRRVAEDFAGAPSLHGYTIDLEARRMRGDRRHVVVVAHVVKRSAEGRLAELGDEDYRGSAYEEALHDGLFDGPEVTAILERHGTTWSVVRTGEGEAAREAYVVGPTDVAWATWDKDFGVPRDWL